MQKKVQILGFLGLICFVLQFIPMPSIFHSSIIVMFYMISIYLFYIFSKAYQVNQLLKWNIWQIVIALVFGVMFSLLLLYVKSAMFYYALIAILVLLILVLAWLNYQIAKGLIILAQKTNNNGFRYSAVILKYSAYTLPILIGFIGLAIANLCFLYGCIRFKSPSAELS